MNGRAHCSYSVLKGLIVFHFSIVDSLKESSHCSDTLVCTVSVTCINELLGTLEKCCRGADMSTDTSKTIFAHDCLVKGIKLYSISQYLKLILMSFYLSSMSICLNLFSKSSCLKLSSKSRCLKPSSKSSCLKLFSKSRYLKLLSGTSCLKLFLKSRYLKLSSRSLCLQYRCPGQPPVC